MYIFCSVFVVDKSILQSQMISNISWQNQKEIQEARLSQRDRATLRVIEYFSKALKVNQGHSKRHP